MASMETTADVSPDLERARLTSPKDIQAETEVHHLLHIDAMFRVPHLNNSVSRSTHLASSTPFSKLYRNVLLADVPQIYVVA